MHYFRLVGAVIVGMVTLTVCQDAVAQEVDGIAARLDRAREVYERQMDRTRDQIESALQSEMRTAARGDKDAFAAAQEAVEAFETRGKLPAHKWRDRWKTKYAADADRMRLAYQDAIAKYATLEDGADRATAVQAEWDIFGSSWDLVPWGANLLDGRATAERAVAPGGVLAVETGLDGAYRLDISAMRIGESGTLFVEFPLVTGERVRVPVLADVQGEVRVLLTVVEGQVCAELGVRRPSISTGVSNNYEGEIVLVADGATFTIESLRVKSVIDEPIPQVQSVSASTPNSQSVRASDVLTRGATGTGDCYHHRTAQSTMRATVTVDNRDGNMIEFRVVLAGTGESFLVRCGLRGSGLTVQNVQQTRAPSGKAPFTITQTERGSGTIRNGVLNLYWTVRGSSPKIGKNRDWTVRLQNVRFE